MKKNNGLIVSICCLTYNHEPYIRQCLEGFLMQQTNFPIEILIHDDASTDITANIIREYEEKYPEIIKPIYQTENQYSKGIPISPTFQFPRAKGKYIAICEGDDYWTDPYKLQKQVDFMEANPDYSLVYHRVKIFDENLKTFGPEENNKSEKEETYELEDIAKRNFIHTPSVVFKRNSLDFSFLAQPGVVVMDYSLWMILAKRGKIKYLPDVMAVYRVRGGSVWELKEKKIKSQAWLIILVPLLKYFIREESIFHSLFIQMKSSYKVFYEQSIDSKDEKKLDNITKRLLIEIREFQDWWFIYMIHVKSSRMYRLKYYLYLLKRNSLNSLFLLKKCLY